MDISGVGTNPEIAVKLQKTNEKQHEKVTSTILKGIDDASQTNREFFNTGHSLNVTA